MAIDNNSFNRAFENKDGFLVTDGPFYTGGTADPTGLDLPVNTLYTQVTDAGIVLWKKYGPNTVDWTKFVSEIFDVPRAPIFLIHNGLLSNGQKVGYSNLTNDADIVLPFKGKLAEVSFSNTNLADAQFRFYHGAVSPANLFYTWSFTDKYTDVAISDNFASEPTFERGDIINIYFDDQGTNPSDMNMGLFFKVLPVT